MMRIKYKNYAISCLIALGIYSASSFLGSLINVLISIASGHSKYADFLDSENYAGLLVVAIFAIFNHIFFAWLTVKLIKKYLEKRESIDIWNFRYSAITVLIAGAIIYPIIFSNNAGYLTYLSHSIGILIFSETNIKKESMQVEETNNDNNGALFCPYCGTNIEKNSSFCRKCGKRI